MFYLCDFVLEVLWIIWEEFFYFGCFVVVVDVYLKGVVENYDVVYGWLGDDEKVDCLE